MPPEQPEKPAEGAKPPAAVMSLRLPPELREEVDALAKAAGQTRTAWILDRLGRPSLSAALDTLAVLMDHGGIDQVLALADSPKLAGWDRSELRDLGQQLVALSKRWPR